MLLTYSSLVDDAVVSGVRYILYPGLDVYPGEEAYPQGLRSSSGAIPSGDARHRVFLAREAAKRVELAES